MHLAKKTALILNVPVLIGIIYTEVDALLVAVTGMQEPSLPNQEYSATTEGVASNPPTQELAVVTVFGAPNQACSIDARPSRQNPAPRLESLSTVVGSNGSASSALMRTQD